MHKKAHKNCLSTLRLAFLSTLRLTKTSVKVGVLTLLLYIVIPLDSRIAGGQPKYLSLGT